MEISIFVKEVNKYLRVFKTSNQIFEVNFENQSCKIGRFIKSRSVNSAQNRQDLLHHFTTL